MKRLVATTGFILGSIVGSFIVFNAATLIVVNAVRGVLLLLPAIFDAQDFRFLFHFAAVAIAGALAYGSVRAMLWVGVRSVPPKKVHSLLLILVVLLLVAVALNLLTTILLRDMNTMLLTASSWSAAMNELTSSFLVTFLLGYVYQPIAFATFVIALIYLETPSDAGEGRIVGALGLLLPPGVLLFWLIAQGVSGGLF